MRTEMNFVRSKLLFLKYFYVRLVTSPSGRSPMRSKIMGHFANYRSSFFLKYIQVKNSTM